MGFAISIILKYAAHEKIQPYSGVIRSMDATIDQKIEELQGLCRKSLNGMLASRCSEIDLFKKNAHCIAQIPHFHIYAA